MTRPAAIDRLADIILESERRATSVARLLHDNAGQTLTAVGFHLQALAGDPAATAELRGYLDQAMENVRLACNTLQSNVIERSELSIAIELLVARFREQAKVEVKLQLNATRRFPAPVAHAVYRVIALALDNVRVHSGANQASIRLTADESGLAVAIQDTGCGFDVEQARRHPEGIGLVLMEAYARDSGMHFHITSTPEHGTIVGIQTH